MDKKLLDKIKKVQDKLDNSDIPLTDRHAYIRGKYYFIDKNGKVEEIKKVGEHHDK